MWFRKLFTASIVILALSPFSVRAQIMDCMFVSNRSLNSVNKFFMGLLIESITDGLDGPADVALDPNGNLHVLNKGPLKSSSEKPLSIAKFDIWDKLITNIPIEIKKPGGVTIDPDGFLYVTSQDGSGGKVLKLDPSGKKVAWIEVDLAGHAGVVLGPIAVDQDGNLYIVDTKSHTVGKYNAQGRRLGSVAEFLKEPSQLAIDHEGALWVSDAVEKKVVKLDKSGIATQTFSKMIEGTAFAVDPMQIVWAKMPDIGMSSTGFDQMHTSVINGTLNRPASISYDRIGNLIVANAGCKVISKFDPKGKFQNHIPLKGTPEALAINKNGRVFVSNFERKSIETFDQFNFLGVFIKGEWKSVGGLAFDTNGNLYVSHIVDEDGKQGDIHRGSMIEKFDPNGISISKITKHLNTPAGLAFDEAGNLLVANRGDGTISKFDPEGKFVSSISTKLKEPIALAIDGADSIYVADYKNGTVSKFDRDGQFLSAIPPISGSGQVNESLVVPVSLTIDREENLNVAYSDERIAKYDPDGKLLSQIFGSLTRGETHMVARRGFAKGPRRISK